MFKLVTMPIRPTLPALGMASVVLAVIAMLLFFLPVLAVPLSICALTLGFAGLVAALLAPGTSLRFALLGLAASSLALAINAAIACAPAGYLRDQNPPRLWQSVYDRPFAPPPVQKPYDDWP